MRQGNGTSVRLLLAPICTALALVQGGCEVDGFFDPSKTGYFEHMPTTIPILERIDVIEPERSEWGQTTAVTPEDLVPSELAYKLAPGDILSVQIFELYAPGQWHVSTRRIDAGGFFRLPEIGEVQAAGMTAGDFERRVTQLLQAQVMEKPLVDVVVEEFGGFTYTIYGAVRATGLYRLNRPDLRLLAAMATAGGVPLTTEKVYVIRQVGLTSRVQPTYLRPEAPGAAPPEEAAPRPIEEIIEELEPKEKDGDVQPGVLQDEQQGPLVDIDDLLPVQVGPPQEAATPQPAPQPPVTEVPGEPQPDETFIYDETRNEWIRVRGEPPPAKAAPAAPAPMVLDRVIEIPFERLKQGDSAYDIVIRPDDRIYVEEPPVGVVYLDGEVLRPGVYSLPNTGRLTLSRLIAAAGGFGPLAIPERTEITRIVGKDREATVRLNLKAIRSRTEPDIYLKPDDHVIVGTNFWAVPLAIVRSGFRATYGFGFLLDRNFGNDVFGPPPTDEGR